MLSLNNDMNVMGDQISPPNPHELLGIGMKSLLARLLIIVAAAVMPALAFQSYWTSESRQARRQIVEEEALRLARFVSAEQQRIIEGVDQTLTVLGVVPAVQDHVPGLCQRYLSSLEETSPRYQAVAIIGRDGHPLCAPIPDHPELDLSERPYFREALKTGGFALGEYAVGPLSGNCPFNWPARSRDTTEP